MLNLQTRPEQLKNKTILVTGAGDGIGKTAAIQFAQLGAKVILLGKTVSKLEAVYDEVVKFGEDKCAIIPLDLKGATPKHYIDMAQTIEEQFGGLDGVLFNASILGNLQPLQQIKEQEFHDVMQVNLNSAFFMTQALLPVLKKSTAASVIYTTSTVGHQGRAYWGTYSISKFATEGMMQILADEYSNSNIRFNCINPGGTRTGMRAKAFPAEDATKLKTPEDIMPLYCYLISDESKDINGQTIDAQPK